jgi:hypothetical protein
MRCLSRLADTKDLRAQRAQSCWRRWQLLVMLAGEVEAVSTPSSKVPFMLCAVYVEEVRASRPGHVGGGGGDYGVMLPLHVY